MFVLFGFDKEKIKDHGPAIPMVCPRCHNPTHFRLVEVSKWFTLFLIPIFPYEWTYWLKCDICSHGAELDDERFERAQRVARAFRKWRDAQISEERYNTLLRKSRLLEYTERRLMRSREDA